MIDGPGAYQGTTPTRNAKWSWGERPPQLYLLCVLAVLAAPAAMALPERLPALLICIGALTLLTNPVSGLGPFKRQAHLYPLLALIAWAGLSNIWAEPGVNPFDRFWPLLGLSIFGILLTTYALELRDKDKMLLGRWLTPAVWALCVLMLIDRIGGGALAQMISHGETAGIPGAALLLLSWPAAGMLFRGARPYQAVLLLMTAGLVQAGPQAQGIMLAWVIGGIIAGLAALLPRVTAGAVAVLASLSVLVMPFLAAQSGLIQKLIPGANDAAAAIVDHFILGRGLTDLAAAGSAVLQVWRDLGIVGAAILCVLIGLLAAAGHKGPPATRATRLGLLTAAVALACIDHDAWRSAWIAVLFITGACAAALPDRVRNR